MISDRVTAGRAVTPVVARRSDADLLIDQLRAIADWARAHRPAEAVPDVRVSREARLDLVRRRDVIERQRQALVEWTASQLRGESDPFRTVAAQRVVLVHRQPWFKQQLTAGLEAGHIGVVADLENGADCVGVVVAEQPDVLVLEDRLPMVTGLEVTRAVRQYSPATIVFAQVADEWEIGPFLEAGARTAYTRRTPPADIAADVRAMLTHRL